MASGKELRRRITSVKNTQQITRAMKMVSAAKLRRAQDAITQARPYAKGLKSVVQGLIANPASAEGHPLLEPREVKRVAVLIMTSDRGLCGSFNANLNKRAERMYREEAANYDEFAFYCVGKKSFEYLSRRKIPVNEHYEDLLKDASYAAVSAIGEELIAKYVAGEVDEIRLIYAEFRSALSQIVTCERLLPVDPELEEANDSGNTAQTDFLFEPDQEQLLEELLPRYFKTLVYKAVLETLASEHGARMAAMDAATSNAGDVIRKLTLLYNNVRQAGITRELLEITAGAEAL